MLLATAGDQLEAAVGRGVAVDQPAAVVATEQKVTVAERRDCAGTLQHLATRISVAEAGLGGTGAGCE